MVQPLAPRGLQKTLSLAWNKETKKKIDETGQKVVDSGEAIREANKAAGVPYSAMEAVWNQLDANSQQAAETSPEINLPPRLEEGGGFPWLLLLAAGGAAAGAIPVAAAGAVVALEVLLKGDK